MKSSFPALRTVGILLAAMIIVSLFRAFFSVAVALGNESHSVDAVLILGGGVARELYGSVLKKKNPALLMVISGGQSPACTRKLFEYAGAPIRSVLLERCSQSTFDNFVWSGPILSEQGIHRVLVVTSYGNADRADWLSRIHLWSRGIAVEVRALPGRYGESGHLESANKTFLDVMRSGLWVLVCPMVPLKCRSIIQLQHVPISECECHSIPKNLLNEYEERLRNSGV